MATVKLIWVLERQKHRDRDGLKTSDQIMALDHQSSHNSEASNSLILALKQVAVIFQLTVRKLRIIKKH